MNALFYILIFFLCTSVVYGNICPSCDDIQCQTTLTQSDCPLKTYLITKGDLCGCCPGCVGGEELSQDCDDNKRCAPGLKCVNAKCILNKVSCTHINHLTRNYMWLPKCDIEGTYSAKQCKGDRHTGRCFCFDEIGNRIFGWDWWRDADDMTCACSRIRSKRESDGFISTLHCEPNGNFEPLQCDSGVCWCAIPETGQIQSNTITVPEQMWTMLPCYNQSTMGIQYLRQCESASNAQKITKRALFIHGTLEVTLNNVRCDYDGTFGSVFVNAGLASCTWRDSKKIGSYQTQSSLVSQMDCLCARDEKIFEENNSYLTLLCGGNGNYAMMQDQNGEVYCVDRDGFAATGLSDPSIPLDCVAHLYYNE